MLIFILSMMIIFSAVVFANNKFMYEAYETETSIFFGGEEVKFDLPVVKINNYTYIPLRETAKKLNMIIKLNEELDKISLSKERQHDFDIYKMFETLIGFKIPENIKMLEYGYTIEDGKQSLGAKFLINENDIEFIKDTVENNGWNEGYKELQLENMCKVYYWDLSDFEETIISYNTISGDIYAESKVNIYITKNSFNEYHLYAFYI